MSANLNKFLDSNYKTVGHIQTLPDGLQAYCVGPIEQKKAVIFISDLFGWNTGHLRNLADFLGEQGYFCVIPRLLSRTSSSQQSSTTSSSGSQQQTQEEDESTWYNLFDFSKLGDYMKSYTFDGSMKPKIMSLLNHLQQSGIDKFSLFSFSWGSWVAAHVLADPDLGNKFCCGVMVHPSIGLEENIFGGSVGELMSRVQKPILFVIAQDDANEYRCGGAYIEPLKHRIDKTEVIEVNEVKHGFIARGYLTDNDTRMCIAKTMNKTVEFLGNCCA